MPALLKSTQFAQSLDAADRFPTARLGAVEEERPGAHIEAQRPLSEMGPG